MPGPTLATIPSMKRKMGESFNEKDDIKKRDYGAFNSDNSSIHPDSEHGGEPQPDQVHGLPSSPPVLPQMSEYDISTTNYTIPDSPVDTAVTLNDLTTSPVKPLGKARIPLHQSSEADFGIDQFNRFKTSSYFLPSSTDIDMEDVSSSSAANETKARDLILQAFEEISPSVSLEGMGLTEVPEQVKDLENLVIFDPEHPTQTLRQLYLTNNKLRSLNPALFKFTKLNVLSLRHNRIDHIPGAIRHLRNLVDLNVSSNRLRSLPPQILELPHLTTFRAGPNPFVEVFPDAISVHHAEDSPKDPCLLHISKVKYHRPKGNVPLLKALCLDAIARYDVTYRETKSWKKHTPKILHSSIAKAISTGILEDHCSECNLHVVEPHAEVYEWWEILANKDVPIKREFCSGKCASRYELRNQHYYSPT